MADKNYSIGYKFTGDASGFNRTTESLTRSLGSVTKNFISIGAAVGATKKVIDLYIQGLKQSGEGADKLERFTIQLKAGFDSLAISIEKASFANLVANWERATKAAGEYADEMDLVNDRMQDLSVKRAAVASSVQMLRTKQAEGTITKAEAAELKKNTEDLLKIEQDIYDEAIKAQVKFIADKRGLNADLFKTLEAGIDRRVGMNEEELRGLDQYVQDYKAFNKQLIKENTSIVKGASTNPFDPGIKSITNWEKINSELETYLSHIPEVARLQIFQQLFASSEDWNKLIGFYTKRNQLEGEYSGLLRRTVVAGNNSADRQPVDGMSYVPDTSTFGKGGMPGLQGIYNYSKEQIERWADSYVSNSERVQLVIGELSGAFSQLGASIGQAAQDGSISFAEAMSVISATAQTTMSILGALSAANIIGKEVESKGAYGIISAIAALASLAAVWGSYVTPEKYAKGGIVYGPTIAQVGEYAGASSNPEVIAPLSKLKGMLGGQTIKVNVVGKIHGRDIYLSAQEYAMVLNENT